MSIVYDPIFLDQIIKTAQDTPEVLQEQENLRDIARKLIQNLQNGLDTGAQVDQKDNSQTGATGAWQSGQALNQAQLKSLQAISMRYPFLPDRIDFNYIDQWLTSYKSAMQTFPNINLGQDATSATQYVKYIINTFGMTQQPLTSTAENIYRMMKNNAAGKGIEPNAAMAYPNTYLQYVYQLILHLQNALLNFKSVFGPSLPQEWQEELNKQVDNSGSAFATHNAEVIQQWVNELPAAQRRVEGR